MYQEIVMNIHEYQAKKILKEFGAPISKGVVITSLDEIDEKIKNLKLEDLFKIASNNLLLLHCN